MIDQLEKEIIELESKVDEAADAENYEEAESLQELVDLKQSEILNLKEQLETQRLNDEGKEDDAVDEV